MVRFLIPFLVFSSVGLYAFPQLLETDWYFYSQSEIVGKPIQVGLSLRKLGYSGPIRGHYQKTVVIENFPEEEIAVFLDTIQSADVVYWNGKRIGNTGSLSPSYESNWLKVRYYKIPRSLLKIGKNEIKVQIECNELEFPCGMFRSIPYLDTSESIKDRLVLEDVYQLIGAALFFGIFLQQGIGFALNRSSKSGLYLAGTAIFFLTWRLPLVHKLHFMEFPFEIGIRLYFFSQFLFPVFLILFVHSLFERKITKLAILVLFFDTVLAFTQVLTLSPDQRFYLVYVWYILLAFKIPILVRLLYANYKKSQEAVVVSIGALVATSIGIVDVVTDLLTGSNSYYTQFGILAFLFSGVFAIALQSARNKRDLKNLNESLEMIVTLRTQELEK